MADDLATFLSKINVEELSFKAKPYYSKAGDCLIFYFEEAESYAERVDGLVTVYRAIEDDRLVGCQIKEVTPQLKRFGSCKLQIEDRGIKLSILLLVSNLVADDKDYEPPRRRKVYEDLMSKAGDQAVLV